MKRLGLGIIVAIGLTLPAFANPPQLKGDYAFTYTEICLLTPSANVTTGVTTGIEHFNGDGTGTVKSVGSEAISLTSPPLPSATNAISFQFTYAFNSDNTFTMTTIPNTFVGYDATGKVVVATLNGMQWEGKVSKDGKSHTLTTITPFVQTITIIGPPTTILYQTCRSNVVGFAAE